MPIENVPRVDSARLAGALPGSDARCSRGCGNGAFVVRGKAAGSRDTVDSKHDLEHNIVLLSYRRYPFCQVPMAFFQMNVEVSPYYATKRCYLKRAPSERQSVIARTAHLDRDLVGGYILRESYVSYVGIYRCG